MKIIIVGAGFTGMQLAKRLIQEKNDVVLIDDDDETVRHASNRLDCLVLQGTGNSLTTLKEAGIAKADALVMLTESDEINMITCSLVNSVYPNVIKIARVRNPAYYEDLEKSGEVADEQNHLYGIDFMIQPDEEAATAIVNAVEHGAVTEIIDFANSQYDLIHITVEKNSTIIGQTIQNLRQIADYPFVVAYIETSNGISLPSGATIIHEDDRLGIITDNKNFSYFLELAGSSLNALNKIALVGAGRIGSSIANDLIEKERQNAVKNFFKRLSSKNQKSRFQEFVIIDKDVKKANAAADRFINAKVFCADITDEAFIEEEKLATFDLVISATHNHELNMITGAYFKSIGVPKTVALVTSEGFASMARNIGVDVAVPIKDAVVDSILSHLRGKSVKELHTIGSGELEIIEFVLPEGSKHHGKLLKDIALNGVFLVLMTKKSSEDPYTIPTGNTLLEQGDSFMLICYAKDTKRVIERLSNLD